YLSRYHIFKSSQSLTCKSVAYSISVKTSGRKFVCFIYPTTDLIQKSDEYSITLCKATSYHTTKSKCCLQKRNGQGCSRNNCFTCNRRSDKAFVIHPTIYFGNFIPP